MFTRSRIFTVLLWICYAGMMVIASAPPDNPNRVPFQEYYMVYDPSTFWDKFVYVFQVLCFLSFLLCIIFVGIPGLLFDPCSASLVILVNLCFIRFVIRMKDPVPTVTNWYCYREEDRFNPNDISNLWKLK